MSSEVTFCTKCWEGDWKVILDGGRLERMLSRERLRFHHRLLIVNNVQDRDRVGRAAGRAVERGLLDSYAFAEDLAPQVLDAFGLDEQALGTGYRYSICELAEPLVVKTPFYLHYAGDCIPGKRNAWLTPALELLEREPSILVANPCWDGKWWEVRLEARWKLPGFFIGHGFSDQCYLARTADMKGLDYHSEHPEGGRYPSYGGNSFEKRVDAWMRNHGRYRATAVGAAYHHLGLRAKPLALQARQAARSGLARVRAMVEGSPPDFDAHGGAAGLTPMRPAIK